MESIPFKFGKQGHFFCDSNNLSELSNELYGYILSGQQVKHEAYSQFDGCYIRVERNDFEAIVSQDFIGSYGLYVYKDEDYFAISSSFLYLIEKITPQHSISINQSYASSLQVIDLCSMSYDQTLIKEIALVPRNAYLRIDITCRNLEIVELERRDVQVSPDSPEGIAILDRWHEKWVEIIQFLANKTDGSLTFDLTGGFDSRLVFSLLVASGVQCDQIRLCSTKSDLHTFSEDYRIASEIASHFGFILNVMPQREHANARVPLTMKESIEQSMYAKMGVHTQLHFKLSRTEKKDFRFTGSGGECLRDYWSQLPEDYLNSQIRRCYEFPQSVTTQLAKGVIETVQGSYEAIKKSYGWQIKEDMLSSLLYRETRCRFHFGRDAVETYQVNGVRCTPLLDMDLYQLKQTSSHSDDSNFLAALIFVRYCPGLLQFPFEGGRTIAEKTILEAQQVSDQYPCMQKDNYEIPDLAVVDSVFAAGEEASYIKNDIATVEKINNFFTGIMYSSKSRYFYSTCYDNSAYDFCIKRMHTTKYEPFSRVMASLSIGIMSYLKEVEKESSCSGYECLADFYRGRKSSEQPTLLDSKKAEILCTMRVDIKNNHEEVGDGFIITDIHAGELKIKKPNWYLSENSNQGYSFEGYSGEMAIDIKCIQDGALEVALRSPHLKRAGVDYLRIQAALISFAAAPNFMVSRAVLL